MREVDVAWITDAAYLTPTIASVASFRRHVDRQCRIVVPTRERDKVERQLRASLPDVEVVQSDALDHAGTGRDSPTIRNRRARMEVLRSATGPMLLVDSDTAFGPRTRELLASVEAAARTAPVVAAVVEYAAAADAYLYFRPRSRDGTVHFVPPEERAAVRWSVFGPRWSKALSAPQPNNGLLLASGAGEVVDVWSDLYERGITRRAVNEADDQVPLAAALHLTGVRLTALPPWTNSLGATRGPFAMYHAYAGLWRDELRAAALGLDDLSDFAAAWAAELPLIDEEALTAIRSTPGPRLHLSLSGFLDHAHLLDDWAGSRRTIVEVGRTNGRGTAYLAELLASQGSGTRFVSLRHKFRWGSVTPDRWFDDRGLAATVDLAGPSEAGWWSDAPVDAVLLNSEDEGQDLTGSLEEWFPRLLPGGVIGGPCYGISDPYAPGVRVSVDRFAARLGTSVVRRGDCFELHKF